VEECLVFKAEARHLGSGVSEGVVGPFEDFFGGCGFELFVDGCEFGCCEALGHILGTAWPFDGAQDDGSRCWLDRELRLFGRLILKMNSG